MTLAIDFGNSRTKAAYFDIGNAKPELLQLATEPPLPSLFYRTKDGNIKVGDEALEAKRDDPDGEVHLGVKKDLRHEVIRVPDRDKTSVVELLTELFRQIGKRALGAPVHGDLCNKICLTTPNMHLYREVEDVLKTAAETAGFPPEGIDVLPEAVAAAQAAATMRIDLKSSDMIVMDCGDLTLDWSYVERGEDGKFGLSTKKGMRPAGAEIGGSDVDMELLRLLKDKNQVRSDSFQLYRVRKLFKEPYCGNSTTESIKESIGGVEVELTGDEIESVIKKVYIEPACEAVKDFIAAVEEATGGKKTPILLVGGSSRLIGLERTLSDTFGHEILLWDIAEYATVYGAVPIPDPNELCEEGNTFLKTEEYPQAVTYFACTIKLDRSHEGARAAIVPAYLQAHPNLETGDYGTVISDFQRTTGIDPTVDTHIQFVEAFLELGRLEEAKQVVEKSPDAKSVHGVAIAAAFCARGSNHLRDGDAEAALADLREAIEGDPKNVEAHVYLAKVFCNLGRLEEAEQSAKDARGLNSSAKSVGRVQEMITAAFCARGSNHLRDGDAKAALADLRKVIERDPKNVKAHVYLAEAAIECEQRQTAIKNVKVALKLKPEDDYAQSVLEKITVKDYADGIKSMAAGSYKNAVSSFTAVIDINAQDVKAYIHLAEAYLEQYLLEERISGKTPKRLITRAEKAVGKAKECLSDRYRRHISERPEGRYLLDEKKVRTEVRKDPDYKHLERILEIMEIKRA